LAQIFPKWIDRLPPFALAAFLLLGAGGVGFFWYYGSPKYTDVGYQPKQPVDYSHKLHAGDLGLDCRYCHTAVEISAFASIPPTQTCMNCHTLVKPESEKLLPVRESWVSGKAIEWIRVHDLPDYVYFNHSAHLRAGVGCASCHGNVATMEKVILVEPLSMSWCLDCHRNPENHLRPSSEITNMQWTPPENQSELAQKMIKEKKINPSEDCSICHR
jgi:hypothetical protein